jgi:hypothetical protein
MLFFKKARLGTTHSLVCDEGGPCATRRTQQVASSLNFGLGSGKLTHRFL